tara:strand:+ start:162 stop:494 length:333 start_codon:yes stop_codon:yes gene_type:complete
MIKYIPILIVLVFMNFGITKTLLAKEERTLNFSSKNIRILWMACFNGGHTQQKLPSDTIALICDCVVDKTRTQFEFDYTLKNAGPLMKSVYKRFIHSCQKEIVSKPSLSA